MKRNFLLSGKLHHNNKTHYFHICTCNIRRMKVLSRLSLFDDIFSLFSQTFCVQDQMNFSRYIPHFVRCMFYHLFIQLRNNSSLEKRFNLLKLCFVFCVLAFELFKVLVDVSYARFLLVIPF